MNNIQTTTGETMKYLASISRFKRETLEALREEGFRSSFKPYLRAKDKEAFMKTVEFLLEPSEEFSSSEEEFNSEDFEKEPLEDLTGLIKHNFTKEELANQTATSFIEKVIAYARIAYYIEYHSKYDNWEMGMNPWLSSLHSIKNFAKGLTRSNPVAMRAWELARASEKLKVTFTKASHYLRSVSFSRASMRANVFSKYTSNGLVVDVNSNSWVAQRWTRGTPVSVVVNEASVSFEAAVAASKVILMVDGIPYKFKTPKFSNPLDDRAQYVSLFEMLYLMRVCKVDVKSLSAPENHVFLTYDKDGVIGVCQDPISLVMNSSIVDLIGPSSPEGLSKGILKTNKSYKGFGEYVPGVGYRSIESSAAKVIARTMKLDKTSKHTMTLDKIYVVTDLKGNVRARKALSTGTVHVPTSVLLKHGQVRAVSSADKGGFKCTLAPVALISKEWDEEGVSIASFGSMKAKGYGIRELGASSPRVVEFCGEPIEIVEVTNVTLHITNHYTIQQYESTARNKLVMSLAEADASILQRAEERASIVKEDTVFVDFICDKRDTEFGGDLKATIQALLSSGEIRKKPKKVYVTPSEFGIMSSIYGQEKSREWADSLIAENQHKKVELERAVAITTGAYNNVHTVSASYFFNKIYKIMVDNGVDTNAPIPSFTSRNFLVDLALAFKDCGGRYQWLEVVGNRSIFLPLGEFMYGSFAEESTIYDLKVQVTGFLSVMLKHLTYGTKFIQEHPGVSLDNDPRFSKIFDQFVYNIERELQGYTLGKKLGKLKAEGLSGVLSVAWWSDTIEDVWCLSKKYYKTRDAQAVIVKHPELFDESITGVRVHGSLPYRLTTPQGIPSQTLTSGASHPRATLALLAPHTVLGVISFAMEGTIFVSEEMALSLQNDSDGDLTRLTWHKDFELPLYQDRVLKGFSSKFHKDYVEKERDFTSGGLDFKGFNTFTHQEILLGIKQAAKAKEGVAKYTALAQKFERYADMVGLERDERFVQTHFLLNTMVQYFSMNSIKHKDGIFEKQLPEYLLLNNYDPKERSLILPLFEEFLKNIGGNGVFDNSSEWLTYIEQALQGMKETFIENYDDPGYLLIGKDFLISREKNPRKINDFHSETCYGHIIRYL